MFHILYIDIINLSNIYRTYWIKLEVETIWNSLVTFYKEFTIWWNRVLRPPFTWWSSHGVDSSPLSCHCHSHGSWVDGHYDLFSHVMLLSSSIWSTPHLVYLSMSWTLTWPDYLWLVLLTPFRFTFPLSSSSFVQLLWLVTVTGDLSFSFSLLFLSFFFVFSYTIWHENFNIFY